MFIDEAIITIYAGNGGNGCSSFYRSKRILKGGPNGGNGGNGGNVFIISDNNINNLYKFNFVRIFKAKNGSNGRKNNCNGKNGENLFISVPINTKIFNLETCELIDNLIENNKYILIAKGGKGGLGNSTFKSSTNRTPNFFTYGKEGEIFKIKLDFVLLSNIGIVGFTNSGKSSLVNKLSNTNFLVQNYYFTTKIPKKSTFLIENYKLISIIDTPALLEGSNLGKGLGIKFLKHLKECDILFYVIDISYINKKYIIYNIKTIYNELITYNKIFLHKKIWIIFNKVDLILNFLFLRKIIKNILKSINCNYKYFFFSNKENINIKILYKNINIFFYAKENKRKYYENNSKKLFFWKN